jgi:hypothetical protein
MDEQQQKEWEKYSYTSTQLSADAAHNDVKKRLEDDIADLEKVVESKSDIWKREFNKTDAKRKNWKPLNDEYVRLKTRLLMLEWERDEIPVFHPENSILAVRVEGDPFKLIPPQRQYYPMLRSTAEMKSSDGKHFTKGDVAQKYIVYT